MALDLETINILYNHGYGDMIPQPMMGKNLLGYVVPYEDWPAELQGYYTYDPEGAEALLDAAGYKRGADGIRFTTEMNLITTGEHQVGWFEALIPYWDEIGVEIEIKAWASEGEWVSIIFDCSYKNMTPSVTQGADGVPMGLIQLSHSDSGWNEACVSDPAYDAMVETYRAATTVGERQRLSKEAHMYGAEQHWYLWGAKIPRFSAAAPWIIGYSGELGRHEIAARLWIDSELKKTMGR
jgi:ABC-type transport system substrate-binding protein